MPLTMTIDTAELRKLERQMARVGTRGRRASFRGRKKAAHTIVRHQKRAAPVDQGILRNSIFVEAHLGPAVSSLTALATGASLDDVATIADVEYAAKQEKEHRGRKERILSRSKTRVVIAASPIHKRGYMRNTAWRHRREIVNQVAAEFRREF